MLPPPPSSLRVEATALETRILMDHGRPVARAMRWKRIAIAVWVASMVLSWVFPILFCSLGATTTLGLAAAVLIDLSRTVVDQIVLRADQLALVHRSSLGRRTSAIPWSTLSTIKLESDERGPRSRDALVVRWEADDGEQWARIGLGRDRVDLEWIRDVLAAVRWRMQRIEADLTETADDEVIEDLAAAVDPDPPQAAPADA